MVSKKQFVGQKGLARNARSYNQDHSIQQGYDLESKTKELPSKKKLKEFITTKPVL